MQKLRMVNYVAVEKDDKKKLDAHIRRLVMNRLMLCGMAKFSRPLSQKQQPLDDSVALSENENLFDVGLHKSDVAAETEQKARKLDAVVVEEYSDGVFRISHETPMCRAGVFIPKEGSDGKKSTARLPAACIAFNKNRESI